VCKVMQSCIKVWKVVLKFAKWFKSMQIQLNVCHKLRDCANSWAKHKKVYHKLIKNQKVYKTWESKGKCVIIWGSSPKSVQSMRK